MNLKMTEAQKTLYYIAENMKMEKKISDEGYEHFQMAIKALAEESVLDKIRAEIEQNAYPIVHGVNNHELGMTLYGILQVFDKYKSEFEPQMRGDSDGSN